MRYPNLTAEYEASGIHISTLRDHAQMERIEDISAVLYGDADLSFSSACALYRLLSNLGGSNHYRIEYLFAPKLAMIDPQNNKGRRRLRSLNVLISSISESDWKGNICTEHYYFTALEAYAKLNHGQPIPYASWRQSMIFLTEIKRVPATSRRSFNDEKQRELSRVLDDLHTAFDSIGK